MFFKKKKAKIVIENNKYNLGQTVSFKYNNELRVGKITDMKMEDNSIYYNVNVGGECPFVVWVLESKIIK